MKKFLKLLSRLIIESSRSRWYISHLLSSMLEIILSLSVKWSSHFTYVYMLKELNRTYITFILKIDKHDTVSHYTPIVFVIHHPKLYQQFWLIE